jgi:hypothetical protein
LTELRQAWEERDQGFGIRTPDIEAIEFRRDALELLSPATWISSPLCASRILAWLNQREALVPDLIDLVTGRRITLSTPAVAVLTATQREQVWAAVNAGAQVSARAVDDGCEYLAHAICEVITEQFPDIARLRLTKVWLVAPGPRLHPPQNWNHHVAPMLECADGMYVIDLYLAPTGPITKAEWLTRARGTASAAGLFDCVQPWELMGCPASAQAGFETATYIPRGDAAAQIQECRRTTT